VARQPLEIHSRNHETFLEEVHSFQFWFDAVGGYLPDQPYGHEEELESNAPCGSDREALIATLCNYCLGETAALEGASGMIGFAPNRQSKIFLATQVIDEARHLEVFVHRLQMLGIEDVEAAIAQYSSRSLLAFKKRLLEFIEGRDWEAAVFAQNVILESMEFATFQAHLARADKVTAEILVGVLKDERRHMGFGENDLGRRLAATPHLRSRLSRIRKELDPLVLDTFEESLDALGLSRRDRPNVASHYLETVDRLGFSK
jgi:1,2-phenylacetyl-CoA epoxidase catalytic subunit